MNRNIYYNSDEELLENINKTLTVNPTASQRTIAENCNISLGMANAVLKRFVERGWIMVRNLNSSKLAYALSEEGMRTLAGRSKKYIQKTFGLINEYSGEIVNKIQQAKDEGKTEVILCGNSYIKFLIEYACQICGMPFSVLGDDGILNDNSLKLIGELSDDNMIEKYESVGFINVMSLVQERGIV